MVTFFDPKRYQKYELFCLFDKKTVILFNQEDKKGRIFGTFLDQKKYQKVPFKKKGTVLDTFLRYLFIVKKVSNISKKRTKVLPRVTYSMAIIKHHYL